MSLLKRNVLVLTLFLAGGLTCTSVAKSELANAEAANLPGHDIKPAMGKPVAVTAGTISADGSGLPQGSGTAGAGKTVYESRCAACHGIDGLQPGNQLVGGIGSLATNRPVKTVGSFWPYATTLFDYIARAMPYNEQKSLSADDTYAVTAYVLMLNGILDDEAVLNEKNLHTVSMPNRSGFVELVH
ncbi:MAG: c-type cytochrome [bacterium]